MTKDEAILALIVRLSYDHTAETLVRSLYRSLAYWQYKKSVCSGGHPWEFICDLGTAAARWPLPVDNAAKDNAIGQDAMGRVKFNTEAFFSALDSHRIARGLSWRKVAEEAQVQASMLTRMSQGRRLDVDNLASLCVWSGLKADDFIRGNHHQQSEAETLARITAHLRDDPHLSKEGAKALEVVLEVAYQQFRKLR